MSPILGDLVGVLLAHQSGPIGVVLVMVPLAVLTLALRAAKVRAERRLAAGDDRPLAD